MGSLQQEFDDIALRTKKKHKEQRQRKKITAIGEVEKARQPGSLFGVRFQKQGRGLI
jgi:hypothetical protein